MNLLLTGATGALGAELLLRLAQETADGKIYVLLRAENSDELRARSAALHSTLPADHARRVIAVAGDVTRDGLGLGANYEVLAGRIGEIYHAAACTRFDAPADYAAEHNVAGTRRVLEFARATRQSGHAGRVHYVSTAFVSGRRSGFLTEDELDCGQEFFNAYEWSKFEAERHVRAAGADLPVTIYRPSVVVGDSRTGRAQRFLGVYQVLRWIHRGLVSTLPCRRDFTLDLAPADYVANAIVRLAGMPGSVGKTFHLTAGPDNALTVGELIEIFLRERMDLSSCRHDTRLGPVRFVPRDLDPAGSRLAPYLPYLTCPKVFDDARTRAMLGGVGASRCREFFPRVARYALECGFRAA